MIQYDLYSYALSGMIQSYDIESYDTISYYEI